MSETIATELDPEDRTRAYCYAVIGRLFFGPPQQDLIARMVELPAQAGDSAFGQAWRDLLNACCGADPERVRQEYDDLFIGVGQAPVTLYTAHYAAPQAPDRHLLRLREQLAAWGLGRGAHVGEPEDHVSGICDVMRWLIETGRSAEEQRRFFVTYVDAGGPLLCAAIATSPHRVFYQHVARFAGHFFTVEREAFQLMEEGEDQ